MWQGLAGCGKSQFEAAFNSTGTLACAGFAALIIDAQPRVAVLLDFFRNLLSQGVLLAMKIWGSLSLGRIFGFLLATWMTFVATASAADLVGRVTNGTTKKPAVG